MKIDPKYLLIVSYLRQNAREKLTRLSKLTQIPVTTIHDKLRRRNSIVSKYTALLNYDKLGYEARARLILAVDSDDKNKVGEFLMKSENVNSLFRINNGFDFLAELVFKKMQDLEFFVSNIERDFKVKQKEVHYILDDLKQESFISNPELVKLDYRP